MSERILLESHLHTKEVSRCGWLFADEVIDALYALGYGAAVVTDHFLPGERGAREKRETFLEGYHAAKEAGDGLGMVVLPGMEIRFADRREDFLVYGMEEAEILDLPDNACEMGVRAFHELAGRNGWLIYQAHPFRQKMLPANPPDIDGMETFNGNPRHNSQNRLAAAFAARHGLRTIAGSDIHREGDAGTAGLLVPGSALTPKAFAAWLRATPHPRVKFQEPPVNGIRYLAGAVPGKVMLEALYRDAGWVRAADDIALSLKGLRSSLRVVTAWDDTMLVGMARAVGDGHTVLCVQEALVLGAYRRRGIGRGLVRRVLSPFEGVRQAILLTDASPEARAFSIACGFAPISGLGLEGFARNG